MRTFWPTMRLGEVLRLALHQVPVQAGCTYPNVGIYSFGRGMFCKPDIDGAMTSATTLYRIRAGQLIYSRLFSFEGAYALVPPAFDSYFVSNEFPTFEIDTDRASPGYIGWLFRCPQIWSALSSSSTGMGNRRQRVHPESILEYRIKLPPMDEQRRIVARIEELDAQIEEAHALRRDAVKEVENLNLRIARDLFPRASNGTVGDWISFQTGYAFKSEWFSEVGIRLARNANIGHGALDWTETVRLPKSRYAEFSRFALQTGDVLISLDRPIISTGVKVARVREEDLPCLLLQRVARACFVNGGMLPEYFFCWLRSPHFTEAIDPGRSNGVPHISHKDIEKIPVGIPALAEQRHIVTDFEAMQAEMDRLKHIQAKTAAEIDVLLPSVLDRAFCGDL